MGFLNKLLGFRWSLYIVQNGNQLVYEGPLLSFLQVKYNTHPLMKIDLGYTGASVLVRDDDL